jgi:hypothetical protein
MFYYLFCSFGLCIILKYASITEDIRTTFKALFQKGEELFSCSMCLGFWCGVIIYLISKLTEIEINFLFPLASSGFCWALDSLIYFILGLDKIVVQKKLKNKT